MFQTELKMFKKLVSKKSINLKNNITNNAAKTKPIPARPDSVCNNILINILIVTPQHTAYSIQQHRSQFLEPINQAILQELNINYSHIVAVVKRSLSENFN